MTTALDVHIDMVNRHPAALAVGVATACWEGQAKQDEDSQRGKCRVHYAFLSE